MDDQTYENNVNEYQTDSDTDSLKSSSFYTEKYKKNDKKGVRLWQLITLSIISSIIGGFIVGSYFQFVQPVLAPETMNYLSEIVPQDKNEEETKEKEEAPGIYKKIEITQSDSTVAAVAEKVSPSIVGIRVSFMANSFFSFFEQEGEGSGIIIRDDGYIMTNHHVISAALDNFGEMAEDSKIEVFLSNQIETPYEATIVGSDERTDLAVLKIDATELPVVDFGDSDNLRVGDVAITIGNPGGIEYMGSISVGVISGLNRSVAVDEGKDFKLIQTDAAISPGNSGGALLNAEGEVIGVNTVKIFGSGYEGLGFAIPINTAKDITDSLIEHKYVKGRPLLGIIVDTRFNSEMAERFNVPEGVLVKEISPLTGAYKAGIERGDIITAIAGETIKNKQELDEIKNRYKAGDVIEIEIYREGETLTLEVELSEDKG